MPKSTYGGMAQLARAPALQAGGQRFESAYLHQQLSKPINSFWGPQKMSFSNFMGRGEIDR